VALGAVMSSTRRVDYGLPAPLTRFVGRSTEFDELSGLLVARRLVTITGPGGVGKTRLAVEVAKSVAGQFADGVRLLELAGVAEPGLVSALATTAEVREQRGKSLLESLVIAIGRRHQLLVIDNCEHLVASVARLCAALLTGADDLRILATSREPLRVEGESQYRLDPLPLPSPDSSAEVLRDSAAVALFADRARLADAHFDLTELSREAICDLVARLDGMPLGLELAAARVGVLGVDQLRAELTHRFRVLVGSSRSTPARHRTMAATVDWSYQLLNEEEQQVLRRLAVFPAGFTLDAAEAVAGAAAREGVLRLVECSLLTPPRTGVDGKARYQILETVRAYAGDRLEEAGELADVSVALMGWALPVAEGAARGFSTPSGELSAARRIDAEELTLQQALDWALDADADAALRLAVALAPWWFHRGRNAIGQDMLRRALAGQETPTSSQVARAHCWLGWLLRDRDLDTSVAAFRAGVYAGESSRADVELVDCLRGLAGALVNLGRMPEAIEAAQRGLELARTINYAGGICECATVVGQIHRYAAEYQLARIAIDEAFKIAEADVSGRVVRARLAQLAAVLADSGQPAVASPTCAEGLRLSREVEDVFYEMFFLNTAIEIDLGLDEPLRAAQNLRAAIRLADQIGDRMRTLDLLSVTSYLCATTGRAEESVVMRSAYLRQLQTYNDGWEGPPQALAEERARKQAERTLGREGWELASERGVAMAMATAVEDADLLAATTAPAAPPQPDSVAARPISAREAELVTLVAQGYTDAQIAAELFISVRTVRSHLDRIRDKTACRRRADLTRLALELQLV
jgi:predicted ATPase/DNA-binding CsgD family transcriptional regulator